MVLEWWRKPRFWRFLFFLLVFYCILLFALGVRHSANVLHVRCAVLQIFPVDGSKNLKLTDNFALKNVCEQRTADKIKAISFPSARIEFEWKTWLQNGIVNSILREQPDIGATPWLGVAFETGPDRRSKVDIELCSTSTQGAALNSATVQLLGKSAQLARVRAFQIYENGQEPASIKVHVKSWLTLFPFFSVSKQIKEAELVALDLSIKKAQLAEFTMGSRGIEVSLYEASLDQLMIGKKDELVTVWELLWVLLTQRVEAVLTVVLAVGAVVAYFRQPKKGQPV